MLGLPAVLPCAPCSPALLSPGRVWEFIESGKLATDQIKFFVLDEAGESNE
jgi:hypothetical protein